MKYWGITTGVIMFSLASVVYAANWISPDGKVGFDLPDDGSLIEVKNPPAPAAAMWTTADKTTRLVFLTQPNPRNARLGRAGLEEGTLKGIPGGTLQSSTETSLSGVPLFTIAATNSQGEYIQQSVMTFNGTVYKIMAGGPTQISSDPHLAGIFQSLRIVDPAPIPPADTFSSQDMSVKAGEIGFLILAVAAVAAMARRSRSRQSKPPELP